MMFQFLAIISAIILLAYSTAASLFGLLSTQWWTGPDGASIGVWASCSDGFNNFESDLTQMCYPVSFDNLENTTENVMSWILIGSIVVGSLCIVSLFFDLLCSVLCICCGGTSVSILTSVFVLGQGAMLTAVCVMMGIHYEWDYPAGMDTVGPAYFMVGAGVIACILSCVLINVDRMACRKNKDKKSKKGGDYA